MLEQVGEGSLDPSWVTESKPLASDCTAQNELARKRDSARDDCQIQVINETMQRLKKILTMPVVNCAVSP